MPTSIGTTPDPEFVVPPQIEPKLGASDPFFVDPIPGFDGTSIRGEPLGCPLGLNDPPEPPPGGWADHAVDTTEVRGRLQVEKLEGRQESGRDAQDENEEDEEIT